MYRLVFIMVVLGFSGLSHARLSCDELDGLATALDDLAEALVSIENIGLNSELDDGLGELTEVLTDVAEVESDTRLKRWIADLQLAWDDMEREDFEDSLDDIIERLDELGARDCSDW
ncbi:hypothetical protein OS175_04560 [Marinicella sp. S1101]|uniref:hypothetical protein n=1 Tax=Marinicella marina TaxID=2996016 RepID=UPI002260FDF0|nr:hypothetical protein [Marinicella marina]MCX7553139.1 hypothetical protein [Marinicella marina]MDJ1138871.1 hypothetical protein [Marinicella marina]